MANFTRSAQARVSEFVDRGHLDAALFWLRGTFINAVTVAMFPLLLALYLIPALLPLGPIPPMIVPCGMIVIASMVLAGSKTFTVTVFDYLFVAWIGLAVASHIFAIGVLGLDLPDMVLTKNLMMIVMMLVAYRASFCMMLINPRYSTRALIISMIVVLGATAVLGLMERYGPGRGLAQAFCTRFGAVDETIIQQSGQTQRYSSIFGGPNLLGYADTVIACFTLGWGLAGIGRITPWKVIGVLALIGFATLSAITCQSRSNLLYIAPMVLYFGVQIRRKAVNQINTMVFAGLFCLGCLGLLVLLSTGKFDYLTSIKSTGVQHDLSYETRVSILRKLGEMAVDIAPLGSGLSQVNNPQDAAVYGFSSYTVSAVDNEWANAFQAFGVWGPVWLLCLYVQWYRHGKQILKAKEKEAMTLGYIAMALLCCELAMTTNAVRVMKPDTGVFMFLLLGAVAGWKFLGDQKGMVAPLPSVT